MIAGTVAIVAAIAAVACLLRVRGYRKWLHVPVCRTDLVSCRGGFREMALHLGPNGFELPHDLDLRGRTVLLRVVVKVRPLGRLLDPFIEIQDGRRTYRQYFERGAVGQRYLNLSPVVRRSDPNPLLRVGLRGRFIHWEAAAWLLMFDPPATEGAGVLVLAPHPDDAEIAAFGMYACHRSWVVTVTAGERATANLPTDVPTQARAHWAALLRVSDSMSVPQLGQVPADRCVNLVCPDGALESMYREPARPFPLACEETLPRSRLRSRNQMLEFQRGNAGCTWNDLVGDLRRLLEFTQPDIVICPHPLVDTHPDHVFTTVALEHAMRDLPGRRPSLFLYVVHTRGAALYPFGPAESLVCLPPGRHAGWVADSIYSHPLEPQLQQAKYFAVEAMHAARNYADREPKSARKVLASMIQEVSAYVAGTGPYPASLLRRAPRPNEIYYVVRGDMLSELLDQMSAAGLPVGDHTSADRSVVNRVGSATVSHLGEQHGSGTIAA